MIHFSYNSYNFTISYNSYLAYELVFLHHLRNSTGPKGPSFQFFSALWDFFEKEIHRRVPLQFFDIFRQNGCRKIPKGPPSQFISALWDFLKFFSIKGSRIHQYFDILKSFCYLCALDMAPTWDVPVLLKVILKCLLFLNNRRFEVRWLPNSRGVCM